MEKTCGAPELATITGNGPQPKTGSVRFQSLFHHVVPLWKYVSHWRRALLTCIECGAENEIKPRDAMRYDLLAIRIVLTLP